MHRKSLVLASILLAATAYAKELKAYQDGKLLQMDSVQCGTDTKDAKKGKTHELLCQEYVVQTEQVLYRVRPKDDKHSTLLPIGQNAQFRLEKNRMLLRVEGADSKEREYMIMSIKPRGDNSADASPAHLNHLQ
ncbi:MAG TPA: hypothetical protein VJX47_06010 [Candidatus Sulfotelmatobacter sp.]|nr:hypothetical protein [Candidatus Sulfotelmatobacter sp.]